MTRSPRHSLPRLEPLPPAEHVRSTRARRGHGSRHHHPALRVRGGAVSLEPRHDTFGNFMLDPSQLGDGTPIYMLCTGCAVYARTGLARAAADKGIPSPPETTELETTEPVVPPKKKRKSNPKDTLRRPRKDAGHVTWSCDW